MKISHEQKIREFDCRAYMYIKPKHINRASTFLTRSLDTASAGARTAASPVITDGCYQIMAFTRGPSWTVVYWAYVSKLRSYSCGD